MIRWKSTAYTAIMATRNAKYFASAVRLARVSPAAKRKPNWLDEYFIERGMLVPSRQALPWAVAIRPSVQNRDARAESVFRPASTSAQPSSGQAKTHEMSRVGAGYC